jgi:phosphoserine phosphatase
VFASASPTLYLTHLGRRLGAAAVIGTTMETVNGRLTGRQSSPNCRGEHKAARVHEYLASHPTGKLWVYGNSADAPMLALADVPVLVSTYRPLRVLRGSD